MLKTTTLAKKRNTAVQSFLAGSTATSQVIAEFGPEPRLINLDGSVCAFSLAEQQFPGGER